MNQSIVDIPPERLIASCIAIGAVAGAAATRDSHVDDAYAAVRLWLFEHYPDVHVDALVSDPLTRENRDVVQRELQLAGAAADGTLKGLCVDLLEAVQRSPVHNHVSRALGGTFNYLMER